MPRMYSSRAASSAYRAHAREVRRDTMKKLLGWVLCAAVAILLLLIEQTSFSFSGNGLPVIPYLLPVWVMLVGWFSGVSGGAWFGVFAGLFCDAAGGNTVYLHPLVFALIGAVAGVRGLRVMRNRFSLYLLYSAVTCVLYSLFRMAVSLITAVLHGSALPYAVVIIENSARETLAAWLWALPLYFVIRIIRRRT